MKNPVIEIKEFGAMGPDGFQILINGKSCYTVKTEAEAEAITGMVDALLDARKWMSKVEKGHHSAKDIQKWLWDGVDVLTEINDSLKKAGVEL